MAGEDPPRTGSVSTIAWIGYDSPNFNPESTMPWDLVDSAGDVAHTVTEANAQAGGVALSQFVDGLNSTHTGGDQPHLTVIGHSYGSTTSAYAAAGGMAADSLVLIGSPGASEGVHHAPTSTCRPGQVFVGAADNDPVSWLGGEDGLLPGHVGRQPRARCRPGPARLRCHRLRRRQRSGVPRRGPRLDRLHGEPHQLLRRPDPRRATQRGAGQHGQHRLRQLRRGRRHGRAHAGGARLPLRLGRRRGAAPRRRPGRRQPTTACATASWTPTRTCATASTTRSTGPGMRSRTPGTSVWPPRWP